MRALASAAVPLWLRLRGFTGTALVVRVGEADRAMSIVGEPHGGIPAHVTIAYPFPLKAMSASSVRVLQQLFAEHDVFDFALETVCRFDSVAYLAPNAVERFSALAHSVQDRFPGNPLYGGAFDTYIPHLTLGPLNRLTPELADAVLQLLPIRARAREVELWAMRHSWQSVHRFPLGTRGCVLGQ
jgi:2'-5' RNA ligase